MLKRESLNKSSNIDNRHATSVLTLAFLAICVKVCVTSGTNIESVLVHLVTELQISLLSLSFFSPWILLFALLVMLTFSLADYPANRAIDCESDIHQCGEAVKRLIDLQAAATRQTRLALGLQRLQLPQTPIDCSIAHRRIFSSLLLFFSFFYSSSASSQSFHLTSSMRINLAALLNNEELD